MSATVTNAQRTDPMPGLKATGVAIDAFHHTVYAVATGIAYELLTAQR